MFGDNCCRLEIDRPSPPPEPAWSSRVASALLAASCFGPPAARIFASRSPARTSLPLRWISDAPPSSPTKSTPTWVFVVPRTVTTCVTPPPRTRPLCARPRSSTTSTVRVNSLQSELVLTLRIDWCVWAPPTGPTTIGESEGQEVAWCTKPGRGTRLIPQGAITGVQFLRAKSYLEVIAFLDQTMLNLAADDYGGELDPHGADLVSALRIWPVRTADVSCSVVTLLVVSCSRTVCL